MTLYIKPNCQPCQQVKELLRGYDYTTKDTQILRHMEEALEKSGSFSTPVLEINGAIIIGYSKERILNALAMVKK